MCLKVERAKVLCCVSVRCWSLQYPWAGRYTPFTTLIGELDLGSQYGEVVAEVVVMGTVISWKKRER